MMSHSRTILFAMAATGALLVLAGCGAATTAAGGQADHPAAAQASQRPGGAPAAGQGGGSPVKSGARQGGGTAQGTGDRKFGAVRVQVVSIQVGSLTAQNSTAGSVVPVTLSSVASLVAGVAARVLHRAGDWVPAGEIVVQLEDAQLRLAMKNAQSALENARINSSIGQDNASQASPKLSLQVQSARSTLAGAQKNYDAQKALFDIGGASGSQLDAARSQLEQAKANLEAAEAALDQNQKSDTQSIAQLKLAVDQGQTQLDIAKLNLQNASIKAPFAGQIAAINVNPGMYVGLNTTVFILVSREKQVTFSVPPADAPSLPVGTTLSFVARGASVPIRISQASSAPIGGVVPMVASVPTSLTLPYGTVGTVSYPLTLAHGALVPIAALETSEDTTYVFTVVDGKAAMHRVVVIGESETTAAVEGLAQGTQVIVNAPPGLLPGSAVQLVTAADPRIGPVRPGGDAVKSLRDLETGVFNRINPAVSFSVRRYVLAIGVFVAVVVFGIVSMLGMGVDLLPAVNIPSVIVRTGYPGATPTVVDQQVTQILENVVSSLAGITDINSSSSLGVSRVSITFDPRTDKNAAANQVSTLVSAAVRSLPSGTTPPTVQTFDPNSQPILQFGISGEGTDLAEVADYVQNTLAPSLQRVAGVANVTVDGAPSRQFEVLLNPDRLRSYTLTPQQVVSAITGSALSLPIGTIVKNSSALTFTTRNTPASSEEIARVLVDPARGITVGNVGRVRSSPSSNNYVRVNGIPQVLVSIQRTTDSNSVAVVQGVRQLLGKSALPSGYLLTFSNDTTGPIQASVRSTYRELFMTALVVAIIVLLFLGKLNTAISVILAIPIALAASPILYRLSGFTFNLVSLLALVIAIGIVVDDSIVVAENVERYRAMGLGLKDAVLRGASEVFSAVVAATLSILSVLLPVSFIGGFIGTYLQQFSLGLAAAVAFSLLEAILFLTVRLAYTPESKTLDWNDFLHSWIRVPQALRWGLSAWRQPLGIILGVALIGGILVLRRPLFLVGMIAYPIALALVFYVGRILLSLLQSLTTMLHGWTEAGLEWIRKGYARSLGGVIRGGVWVLVGSVVFLGAIAAFIVPRVPFNFVPQTDSGTLTVRLRYPAGTPPAVTNEGTGRIEAFLSRQPEVDTVQALVGNSGGAGAAFSGANSAEITVQLVPVGRRASVFSIIPLFRTGLLGVFRDQPTAQVFVSAGGGFGGFGSSLQLSIVAPSFDTLQNSNGKIIRELQTNPSIVDVSSSLSDTSLENDFVPDPSRLNGTGITPAMIAQALQTYTSGAQAANVVTGGLSYPILVMADPTTLSGGQSLLNLPIYSPTLQTMLQVGQLGSFVLTQAPVSISRYNRQYTGQLTINLAPGAPPALAMQNQITAELKAAGLLEGGVGITTNQRFNQAALASQLATTGPLTFLLALFLAYLVMAAQFNSWRYPIYLLLPVPLAIVGALLLVAIVGGGLDIFGLMGMLMLIGLSAKNAILYLDFVVERIGKMPLADALIEAAQLRFRPIIMTTLTVLVISFPLILGKGEGSEFGQRMGIVMLGGIVFSAILTFFVVPAAFYVFERRRVEKGGAARTDPSAAAAQEARAELDQR